MSEAKKYDIVLKRIKTKVNADSDRQRNNNFQGVQKVEYT